MQSALHPLSGAPPVKIFEDFCKFDFVCKNQHVQHTNRKPTAVPIELRPVNVKTHAELAGELAGRITALLHEYDGLPLALVLGTLRVVEHELIADAR